MAARCGSLGTGVRALLVGDQCWLLGVRSALLCAPSGLVSRENWPPRFARSVRPDAHPNPTGGVSARTVRVVVWLPVVDGVLKVQSTSPKSPLFWHYSPRWSALWARLRSQRATAGVSGFQCGWRADVSLWCASRGSARARADPHAVFFQKSQVIWVSSLLLGIEKTAEFQRSHFNFQKVYMGIACDISV